MGQERGHFCHAKMQKYKSTGFFKQDQVTNIISPPYSRIYDTWFRPTAVKKLQKSK
jgi:hypothetical protein